MRIAILKLSSLGDVIHALPVAHALRRRFPDAHLAWLVEARESALLQDHPDLDSVIPVDTRKWRALLRRPAGVKRVKAEVADLVRRLREHHFDVAIDLQGLIKSGILAKLTGAPFRIGFGWRHCREPFSACFTNLRVLPPSSAIHVVEQCLSLLEPFGVRDRHVVFHVPSSPEAERRIEEFFAEQGIKPRERVVALNPGAGRPEKRWPLLHFRVLAERLSVEAGVRVLLLWGPDEEALVHRILSGLAVRPILGPRTSLPELAALLRRCTLMVGSDTGPLHLAAALGTPTLGLYGPTSGRRNGPYGDRGRVLQSPDGTMAAIQPETVFRAATELLG
jgi:lipopolysaccharide heptosyltransferase I